MGADNHPTNRVGNASMDMKRERLKSDLEALSEVKSVRDDVVNRKGVVFSTNGTGNSPKDGDLSPRVLRTLADHNAFLPQQQPGASDTHGAIILMDR